MDSSGDPGLVHRKEEADNTRDTDPQIRFMEKFRKFFNPEFQEGGPNGRYSCI